MDRYIVTFDLMLHFSRGEAKRLDSLPVHQHLNSLASCLEPFPKLFPYFQYQARSMNDSAVLLINLS